MDWSWQDDAACKGADLNIFFPSVWKRDTIGAALTYCQACPVTAQCGAYALEAAEPFGIWGGLTLHDRIAKGAPMRAIDIDLGPHGSKAGTITGYYRERTARVTPCDPCREAYNAHERRRRPHRKYEDA